MRTASSTAAKIVNALTPPHRCDAENQTTAPACCPSRSPGRWTQAITGSSISTSQIDQQHDPRRSERGGTFNPQLIQLADTASGNNALTQTSYRKTTFVSLLKCQIFTHEQNYRPAIYRLISGHRLPPAYFRRAPRVLLWLRNNEAIAIYWPGCQQHGQHDCIDAQCVSQYGNVTSYNQIRRRSITRLARRQN